jgi:hypothetical protein
MSTRLARLVIMGGLHRDAVSPERTPNLWRITRRGTSYGQDRSLFPSATLSAMPGPRGVNGCERSVV